MNIRIWTKREGTYGIAAAVVVVARFCTQFFCDTDLTFPIRCFISDVATLRLPPTGVGRPTVGQCNALLVEYVMNPSATTLVDLLADRAAAMALRTGYVYLADGEEEARRFSYLDLFQRARAIAAQLQVRPVRDPVLLLYGAGLEYIAAFFGCVLAGVPAVPVVGSRSRRRSTLETIATDCGATIVLCDRLSRPAGAPGIARATVIATDDLAEDLGSVWHRPAISSSGIAYLQYTSGSTGVPRGVIVTHENVLSNLRYIDMDFKHDERSVAVSWLPHFHDLGLVYGILAPLYGAFRCIILSPESFAQQPLRWLRAISRWKGTHSAAPNFAYEICARQSLRSNICGLDLSTWRVACTGAEPISAATLDRFAEKFECCGFSRTAFFPAYGLAEATLKVTSRGSDESVQVSKSAAGGRSLVGCGCAHDPTAVLIVDPDSGTECRAGETGEIWVSGPGIAMGYWNNPEQTHAVFQARLADRPTAGPFLRTGDLGFLRQGTLFVVGRLKDIVIVRGRNYYPEDIECSVRESVPEMQARIGAAFSIDADGSEETGVVFECERKTISEYQQTMAAMRSAIISACEVNPRVIALARVGGLPRTSSGKVRRQICRERFLSGQLKLIAESIAHTEDKAPFVNDDSMLPNPTKAEGESFVRMFLTRLLGSQIAPEHERASLVSLGLDSMRAAALQSEIRRKFGAVVPAVDLINGLSFEELVLRLCTNADITSSLTIARSPGSRAPCLSLQQERLWPLASSTRSTGCFHFSTSVTMRGPLDINVLRSALSRACASHDQLRTAFIETLGNVEVRLANHVATPLEVTDLSFVSLAEQPSEVRKWVIEDLNRPIDLAKPPLARFRVVRRSEQEHELLLTFHHLISDAWSVRMFVRQLMMTYESLTSCVEPDDTPRVLTYADFAAWQRNDTPAPECVEYWGRRFADSQDTGRLVFAGTGSQGIFARKQITFAIPADLDVRIRETVAMQCVTPTMLFLAALGMVLVPLIGAEDVVVGVPTSGRECPEVQNIFGFFAFPLPIRIRVSATASFYNLLQEIRRAFIDDLQHAVPLSVIGEAIGSNRRLGGFLHVMLNVMEEPFEAGAAGELRYSSGRFHHATADCALFLNVMHGECRGFLEYDGSQIDERTAEFFIARLVTVLNEALSNPHAPVHTFGVAPDSARKDAPLQSRRYSIIISASFNTDPIRKSLEYWNRELRFNAELAFAPAGAVMQQLLDPESQAARNENGLNVFLIRPQDWVKPTEKDHSCSEKSAMLEAARLFVRAVATFRRYSTAQNLIVLCPAVCTGSGDDVWDSAAKAISELTDIPGVYVLTAAKVLNWYPVQAVVDPYLDRVAQIPFTEAFFAALGTSIMRTAAALRRAAFKAIVLDCDDTLWEGVCGEQGPRGVRIGSRERAIQKFVLEQKAAGMVLCVCSANNESDVRAVFSENPEMLLRTSDITEWAVSWKSKSDGVKAIASRLSLSLDTLIVLDDDAVYCSEIRARCPGTLVLQVPLTGNVEGFLRHVWAFDQPKCTEEARHRSKLYADAAERENMRGAMSLQEFIASLQLQIEFASMEIRDAERTAELTQRVTQFTFTGVKKTIVEVLALARSPNYEWKVVRLTDRFGDYGVVGAVLLRYLGHRLGLEILAISCRALGRGVEQEIFKRILAHGAKMGCTVLEIHVRRTTRNMPAMQFLESLGISTSLLSAETAVIRFDIPGQFKLNARDADVTVHGPVF